MIQPKNHLLFFIIFLGIAIADLYAVAAFPEHRVFTKPAIMMSLLAYYIVNTQSIPKTTIVKLFGLALVFAWGGDVLLIGEGRFMFGLLSFLIMQILYTLTFREAGLYFSMREKLYLLIMILVVISTNVYLSPYVGDLQIPVVVYTAAIALMSFVAYARNALSSGYLIIFIGTVLFLISDGALSYNVFVEGHPYLDLMVMSTYIAAQGMIVYGFLLYLLNRDKDQIEPSLSVG